MEQKSPEPKQTTFDIFAGGTLVKPEEVKKDAAPATHEAIISAPEPLVKPAELIVKPPDAIITAPAPLIAPATKVDPPKPKLPDLPVYSTDPDYPKYTQPEIIIALRDWLDKLSFVLANVQTLSKLAFGKDWISDCPSDTRYAIWCKLWEDAFAMQVKIETFMLLSKPEQYKALLDIVSETPVSGTREEYVRSDKKGEGPETAKEVTKC